MDIKDVENLAELARLELSNTEKEELLKDMKSILAYVGQVEKAKAGESKGENGNHNVWREDASLGRDYSPEAIVEQFPKKDGRYLKVKKIL